MNYENLIPFLNDKIEAVTVKVVEQRETEVESPQGLFEQLENYCEHPWNRVLSFTLEDEDGNEIDIEIEESEGVLTGFNVTVSSYKESCHYENVPNPEMILNILNENINNF